jgi:hypothetical protein
MDTHPHLRGRTVATTEVLVLAGFVVLLALPSAAHAIGLAVLALGALAVAASAVVVMRRRSVPSAPAVVAIASAAGLVGSMLYLRSLADEPTAIPIAGVGVLFLSLVGLVVSAVLLHRH